MKTYSDDEILSKQDAAGTFWPNAAAVFATIGLLLLPAYHRTRSVIRAEPPQAVAYNEVDETHQTAEVSLGVGYFEIFEQLNRIYDYLLAEPADLDDDARHILYSNLWSLYE
jgi:hypothetical protein